MSKSKIKLFKVNTLENGTVRLQSQLELGSDSCSFIIEDGVLKSWKYNENGGVGFYETNIPYEIVENIGDMKYQEL